MITLSKHKDLQRLRRHAVAAQGLLGNAAFAKGKAGAIQAIERLGYVQLDTISVVERAHNHVWHSRVPGFTPDMSNELLESREIYEYWAHAAAYLPMSEFRFSEPDKASVRAGTLRKQRTRDPKMKAKVLQRIREEGPMSAQDMERDQPGPKRKSTGWWDWKPGKKALEMLYLEGDLMVSSRAGFRKTYDLTERVLPNHVDTRRPTAEEWAEHLLNQQLRCHGIVTEAGISYGRRDRKLRAAIKILLEERLAARQLEVFQLLNGEQFYGPADVLEQPLPRGSDTLKILSPFDNAVIQRKRLMSLFGFDYTIECYVPEGKRRYGYFVLPLLYRDEMVGRMDCKAYRDTGVLSVKALFIETPEEKQQEVCDALAKSLVGFARFQGCQEVRVENVLPEGLMGRLQRLL